MTPKMIRNLNLVFEELTTATLIQRQGTLPIHIEIEYSSAEESAQVHISYSGAEYNPLLDEDSVSASIVRNICSATRHYFDEKNHIILDLES